MSRRKQLNPKPLLKGDCENSIDEMGLLRGPDEEFHSSRPSSNADDISTSETPMIDDRSTPPSHGTISPSNSTCSSPPLSPTSNSIVIHENHCNESNSIHQSTDSNSSLSPTQPPLSIQCSTTNVPIVEPPKIEIKTEHLPKLRLNAILASDPALQPEAKDIKCIRATNNDTKSECDQIDLMTDDLRQQLTDKTNEPTFMVRLNNVSPSNGGAGGGIDGVIQRVPGFVCGPCGIKFSSLTTLEAHQTYYCTHRKDADETPATAKISATGDDTTGTEPSTKCIRTGKQYACSQCSYSADKKVSLNRHMRMHQSSPTPSSVTSNGDDSSSQIQQVDRYCTDCDIRFSSTKTYRAHKQHYCSSRHRDGSTTAPSNVTTKTNSTKTGSVSPPETTKSPPVISPPQPYLALPTNPIVIIPYSLIRGASVLPGPLTSISPGTTNPDLTCFVLKNGSLHPIAQALTLQTANNSVAISSATNSVPASDPQIAQTNNNTHSSNVGNINSSSVLLPSERSSINTVPVELLKSVRKKDSKDQITPTIPLDLSVRRLSTELLQQQHHHRDRGNSFSSSYSGEHARVNIELMMEGKENLSIDSNSVTPEQIVCAPSLPGSPPLTPSPKRNSQSPRGILAASPNLMTSSHHHHQQSAMLRSLLPSDLAARLSEPSLSVHHVPGGSLMDRQNVELALRLNNVTTISDNSQSQHMKSNAIGMNKKSSTSTTAAVIGGAVGTNASNAATASQHSTHGQPQIFVKQGVSKCKECNIVFCKYENYLAHKKHYCSARNLDDKDGVPKASPPPSPSLLSTNSNSGVPTAATAAPPHAYQQLICAACGIKFTSLDNLSAHQMYYCPKRIEIPIQTPVPKDKCSKCKSNHDANQQCSVPQHPYKCPMCDVISSNAAETRRHIETHAGVKAFRCSMCGYKGNTLRGMRTHIRMHSNFDKKLTDFNEEHYISCILEEDGIEIPATTAVPQHSNNTVDGSTVGGNNSANIGVSNQLHFCDKCNYSSSYKGNVVRHVKLVHSQNQPMHSTSPSLGEGGESLLHIDDLNKQQQTSYTVTIKTEPTDDLKSLDNHIIKEPPLKMIKLETKDTIIDDRSIIIPIPSPQPLNERSLNATSPTDIISNNRTSPMASSTTASTGNHSADQPKYCNICDIKFNYLNTFIAHKKFYCKNSDIEMVESNTPSTTPTGTNNLSRGTETPVL